MTFLSIFFLIKWPEKLVWQIVKISYTHPLKCERFLIRINFIRQLVILTTHFQQPLGSFNSFLGSTFDKDSAFVLFFWQQQADFLFAKV